MMDLLRESNIEIHKVSCGELPTLNHDFNAYEGFTQKDLPPNNGTRGPNTGVKVAMVSVTFQKWSKLCILCGIVLPTLSLVTDTASPSQWSTVASEDIDLDHTNDSRGTPPTVPGNLTVPAIVQKALGKSHPTYVSRYSQGAVSPPHSRMPVGYGTVDEPQPGLRAFRNVHPTFSQSQDPAGLRNAMERSYSHQSANELQSHYPLGIVHRQNPQPMTAARRSPPQRHVGVQNTFAGSHSHRLSNEPPSLYPPGFVHPQNQQPMTAARRSPPQSHAGVQNTLGGPHSQRYLNCTIFCPSL